MKLYALYFSPTGGTKKVLDIICTAWNCPPKYINLSDIPKGNFSITFNETDICIVSVPSFSGCVPQFIIPILQHPQGNNAKVILISTYGNRAFDDTLLELKDTMEQSGFLCYCAIAAVTQHSVMPKYGAGRPDSDDIKELTQFSVQCWNVLKEPFSPLNVPGNKPYRKYIAIPITPKADKSCIDCGLCHQKCPVHAISSDNYQKCNTSICISCLQCITICPRNARHVNKLILKIAERKMKKSCSGRKPNLIFLPPKQAQNYKEKKMDYREKAVNCVKDTALPVLMQWFQDSGCDMDTYCQKYGETEFSFAKVIEQGHIYEMGYPKCVCPEALAGGKEASFCECSRQGMIYVLENLMPQKHIEVETIETVLSGAEKCRFKVVIK